MTHGSSLATGPKMVSSLSCSANIMLWFLLCTDKAEELEQSMVGKSVLLKYGGNAPASIYVGWINTAVATSSWALVSICMSHLYGWETKCWDVGKLARETESLLGGPALSMSLEHASRPQFIFTTFSAPKPKMSGNTWGGWWQLQSTPLRSSNSSPSNFCFHGKRCPVYFVLYYSPLILRDVTGSVGRQTKRWACSLKNCPITSPITLQCFLLKTLKKQTNKQN